MLIVLFIPLARSKNYYYLVGLVIGWLLLHGGPRGNFFSTTLFNTIAHGPAHSELKIEDIPDTELVENLNKVVASWLYILICSLLHGRSLSFVNRMVINYHLTMFLLQIYSS